MKKLKNIRKARFDFYLRGGQVVSLYASKFQYKLTRTSKGFVDNYEWDMEGLIGPQPTMIHWSQVDFITGTWKSIPMSLLLILAAKLRIL